MGDTSAAFLYGVTTSERDPTPPRGRLLAVGAPLLS